MEETQITISEAGKLVGVEPHVLRYWEEELRLDIPRNGKGHRCYSQLHIQLLKKIRELKEKGYQLKAIELVLNRMLNGEDVTDAEGFLEQNAVHILKEEGVGEVMEGEEKLGIVPTKEENTAAVGKEKMEQFQQIMNHIIQTAIGQAIRENNAALSEEISRQVNDRMVQELEYMMRISDEKEEERFRMLDEALRAHQKENKGKAEAAATRLPFFRKKRFGKSGKKMA